MAEGGGEVVEEGVVVVAQEDEKFTREQCSLNCYMIMDTLCQQLNQLFHGGTCAMIVGEIPFMITFLMQGVTDVFH